MSSAEGTVAQAQAALARSSGVYKVRANRSLASPRSLYPASLADMVTGVLGLDESAVFVETHPSSTRMRRRRPASGTRRRSPTYWAQLVSPYRLPDRFHGVVEPVHRTVVGEGPHPDQIKGAYGISCL